MNKIPVVFTFDKRIILAAAVAIKSLIDSAKPDTSYDIWVFHPDIDEKTIKNFNQLTEGTNHNINFKYIDPKRFEGAPKNNGSWTEIVYYRLLTPELLPQYDKAIYVDIDVLFKGDLTEAYNLDISDYECAAVPVELNNKDTMICHKYFPENTNKYIYISSFLIMNLKKMREMHTVERFEKVIKEVNDRLKFFDLDTLNIAIDKFYDLPFSYGVFQSIYYNDDITKASEYSFLKGVFSDEELEQSKKDVVFVHYAGKMGKPWRMKHPYQDYKECMNTIPKNLKKYTFRDIRKMLFNKF